MFKNFQRKLTLRKGFVISVISLIVIDAIFLTIYYQLYFNSHLYNKYADLNNKLSNEVKEIIKRIDNLEDADKYLDIGADRLGTSRIVKLVKNNK